MKTRTKFVGVIALTAIATMVITLLSAAHIEDAPTHEGARRP